MHHINLGDESNSFLISKPFFSFNNLKKFITYVIKLNENENCFVTFNFLKFYNYFCLNIFLTLFEKLNFLSYIKTLSYC